MTESIKIKEIELFLDTKMIQTSPSGRQIKYSGIRKKNPEYYKSNYIYTFIYLDNFEILEFEYDSNGNFIKKILQDSDK